MTSSLPWMTWATLPAIRSKSSGNVRVCWGPRPRRLLGSISPRSSRSWSCGALSVGGCGRTPRSRASRARYSGGSPSLTGRSAWRLRSRATVAAWRVDIGGTKLAVGHRRRRRARSLARAERRRPAGDQGAERLFARAGRAGRSGASRRPAGPAAGGRAGSGCGGPMEAGGDTVSPLNIPAWRDFPLRARLAERTGLPTFVDNDAKALALGEGWLGAAAGERDFIAMVVSTGVGGGLVFDGRLLDGADGQRRPHRPRRRRARRPAPVRCGGRGLPGGRGVGHRHPGDHRRRPGRAPAPRSSSAPAGSSAGRWRRSPTCSTCPLACVAGSVALGLRRAVLRRRPGRAAACGPGSTSPATPDRPGRARARRPAHRRRRRRLAGPRPRHRVIALTAYAVGGLGPGARSPYSSRSSSSAFVDRLGAAATSLVGRRRPAASACSQAPAGLLLAVGGQPTELLADLTDQVASHGGAPRRVACVRWPRPTHSCAPRSSWPCCATRRCGPPPCARSCGWPPRAGGAGRRSCPCRTAPTSGSGWSPPTGRRTGHRIPTTSSPTCAGAGRGGPDGTSSTTGSRRWAKRRSERSTGRPTRHDDEGVGRWPRRRPTPARWPRRTTSSAGASRRAPSPGCQASSPSPANQRPEPEVHHRAVDEAPDPAVAGEHARPRRSGGSRRVARPSSPAPAPIQASVSIWNGSHGPMPPVMTAPTA